jgi:hypothetical protein
LRLQKQECTLRQTTTAEGYQTSAKEIMARLTFAVVVFGEPNKLSHTEITLMRVLILNYCSVIANNFSLGTAVLVSRYLEACEELIVGLLWEPKMEDQHWPRK